jgi:hypothetical protein
VGGGEGGNSHSSRKEKARTVAALLEAVLGVAVVGEDDDAVAALLQAHGGVDDEAFGAADAQVRVEEDEGALGAAVGIAAGAVGGGVRRGYGESLGGHGCGCRWRLVVGTKGVSVVQDRVGKRAALFEKLWEKSGWGYQGRRGVVDPSHWLASHVGGWW